MRTSQTAAYVMALTAALVFARAGIAAPCAKAADNKPCPAQKPPGPGRSARDRYLHRPATPEEQAETARLNRDFNHGSQQNAPLPAKPDQAPPAPPRQAENPPPASYQSQLEEYRALREAYDRQLRAYYRAFPPQNYARTAAPAMDERPGQDAARADAWHGYNGHDGLSNGY